MDKKTLLIFGMMTLSLSILFALYHFQALKSIHEETLSHTPLPTLLREGKGGTLLPKEFVSFIKEQSGNSQGTLSKELFALKKYAFAECLYQVSSSTNLWKKDESSRLFEKDANASLDELSLVEESVKEYLRPASALAIKEKGLISLCLDFYDSSSLKETLNNIKTQSR